VRRQHAKNGAPRQILYLEMERSRLIEDTKTPAEIRERAKGSRTHGMQEMVLLSLMGGEPGHPEVHLTEVRA